MEITSNAALAELSTMHLGGVAAHQATVTSRMELLEALSWAQANGDLPVIMVGSGSNVVWRDEGFAGLVIVNRILRYEVFEEDETNIYVTIGSGENWDSVVARTVEAGFSGLEALSLIPGTAGATPIQNVGAYGQEIGNVLVTVEAFDVQAKDFVTIAASECGFGYRHSRFNTTDHGRFFITGITVHLTKTSPQPPFYASVQEYFTERSITVFTPLVVRQAVIAIRSAKLPDPAVVHNCGSFFANPIVSQEFIDELNFQYGKIPYWSVGGGSYKLPAAWLIQQAGYKDYHDPETGMATWAPQPLVLVNETAKTTADLMKFKQKIVDAVQAKFKITLVQEPELLPAQS